MEKLGMVICLVIVGAFAIAIGGAILTFVYVILAAILSSL